MKVFSMLTAFLAADKAHRNVLVGPARMSRSEAEDCFLLKTRRRLLERYVNNELFVPLTPPDLYPGDVVRQKSMLLDPDTNEEIGSVHTLATILDKDVRLALGAYNITSGPRTGIINFQALIPNCEHCILRSSIVCHDTNLPCI